MKFEELGLTSPILRAIDSEGYSEPTPIQVAVIPKFLEGRDIVGVAQTGTGKTAGFTLPILELLSKGRRAGPNQARTLILTPTRELAAQVGESVAVYGKHLNMTSTVVFGGVKINPQMQKLRRGVDILVATPGRLMDLHSQNAVKFDNLEVLVLDEADRMLDMGFREDVLKIAELSADSKQVLLLSATLSHRGVGDIAETLLHEPQQIAVGQVRQPHSSITHQLILADSQEHKDKLLTALIKEGGFHRALVFSNKRTTAVRLSNLLRYEDLRCGCLHGEMSTEERKHVMHQFHDGKVHIVCASDLAARGLDVSGIDLVVNYDIPYSGDNYLHRTGRTGRAGAKGLAVSLANASEWNMMVGIERYLALRFERRTLTDLKAKYSGPKKVKSSGKASGVKKKKEKATIEKSKTRTRNQKNIGKRRAKATDGTVVVNDGFTPPKKKKPRE